jgi:alpha-glucosidase
MKKASNNEWWRGGVIYQIYPRSFQDSNGDGVGDLRGITARLGHVARLGADGIWLSPIFKSPMKDFGYDVSDYRDIDPLFGTLDDFRALVKQAHELGLKVMIDQVLSHTSDQHPWFKESRSSRENARADWYIWADAKHDGNPPNNWLSIFGGSAWQWDTGRLQYYMHNFLTSQPDLNFHNPDVQQALLDDVRFWLELGVDGYRLDTANFYFHDQQLRSNPGRGQPTSEDPAVDAVNPYGWQWHHYDKSQPENLVFMQRLRALLDEYPDTTMVGEIGDDDGLGRMAEYTRGGDKLHMAYCFDLLGKQFSAPFLHGLFSRFLNVVGDGWPCWALSNHDSARLATRWGGEQPDARLLRLAAALQMTLRGSPCIYQGDELGLTEAQIAFEDLQDPFGINLWPKFKGRDGCRTPMPWVAEETHGGFSTAKPWLPSAPEHRAIAVNRQQSDNASMLHYYTRLLHWRRGQAALTKGSMEMLPLYEQVVAFARTQGDQRLLCIFNFSAEPVRWELPAQHAGVKVLPDSPVTGGEWVGGVVQLQPWGGMVVGL